MRHYGAPTRVLDWSYSIFVAAYFALSASKPEKPCWIWAVNANELNKLAEKFVPGIKSPPGGVQKSSHHFREFFMADHPKAFVATTTPYRLNERLAIQRSIFLCPGDVSKSFVDTLAAIDAIDSVHEIEIHPNLTTRKTVRAVTRHRHCPHGKRMVHEAFAVDSAIVWSVFAQRRHRSSIKTAGFCWMNLLRITAPIDVRTEVLPDIKT